VPHEGLAPLTVTFSNTSTGGFGTSLLASGDRITTTLESPTYQYSLPGAYTVTLTVSGAGGTDAEIKEGYITVVFANYLPVILRGP
jgi:PKD repeat protein